MDDENDDDFDDNLNVEKCKTGNLPSCKSGAMAFAGREKPFQFLKSRFLCKVLCQIHI